MVGSDWRATLGKSELSGCIACGSLICSTVDKHFASFFSKFNPLPPPKAVSGKGLIMWVHVSGLLTRKPQLWRRDSGEAQRCIKYRTRACSVQVTWTNPVSLAERGIVIENISIRVPSISYGPGMLIMHSIKAC